MKTLLADIKNVLYKDNLTHKQRCENIYAMLESAPRWYKYSRKLKTQGTKISRDPLNDDHYSSDDDQIQDLKDALQDAIRILSYWLPLIEAEEGKSDETDFFVDCAREEVARYDDTITNQIEDGE